MNIFKRFKRFFLMEDVKELEARMDAVEKKVFRSPDLIGFDRVEPDEDVTDWDDSNKVWPMKWEEEDA